MLGPFTGCVLEFLEGCFNISRHGEVDPAVGIIPGEFDATVETGVPICGGSVGLFEDAQQMFCMFSANVFDGKVIYHKAEGDGTGLVFEKAMDVG